MRLILHPVLHHPRSRIIFFMFLGIACFIGGMIWWLTHQVLAQAHILAYDVTGTRKWYLNLLLSAHFKYGLILVAAIIGAGLTAHHVVGPVKRIERWCRAWLAGDKVSDLVIRDGDKFYLMVQLINELRHKYDPSKE